MAIKNANEIEESKKILEMEDELKEETEDKVDIMVQKRYIERDDNSKE